MNAKYEITKHADKRIIKCAKIIKDNGDYYKRDEFTLRVGHTQADMDKFLQSLDFNYDDGYGLQKIEGNIWYQDGTWSDRGEYDGSEWWQYQSVPEIPEECTLLAIDKTNGESQ